MLEQISFDNYKNINAVHYSLLKSIADSGHLYSIEGKKGDALDLGRVTEDLIIPIEADKKNYHYLTEEKPTAMTLDLANFVLTYCEQNNLTFNQLKKLDENEEIIYKILDENNLWKKQLEPTRKANYKDNKQFWEYIKASLASNEGKILITPQQWEKANELANILQFHRFTKDYFNRGENQVTYVFKLNGVLYKIRIDKLIVDHDNRTIQPIDLKTGSPYANQFEINFFKLRYYLQQSLYSLGVHHMMNELYPGYEVLDFKFIYISTTELKPYPVIVNMSEKWAEAGYEGFHRNGRYYKGIKELTEEYLFYNKNGKDFPKEVYENNGVICIDLPN